MKTALEIELDEYQKKRNAYKQTNFEWLKSNEHLYTHALTLTFNPSRIYAYTRVFNKSIDMQSEIMVPKYQDSMRRFIRYMNKDLYGSSGVKNKKMVIVPVIEGLFGNNTPHYHCCIGVDKEKFDGIEASVKNSWAKVPFSGYEIKVVPYRDSGWLTYINKISQNPNQITIDLDNANLGPKS